MLTAAPSLRPCQRDQVQRVVGIQHHLSVIRLPGGIKVLEAIINTVQRGVVTQSGGDVTGDLLASLINRE
jgi:catalase (peroxidase I)